MIRPYTCLPHEDPTIPPYPDRLPGRVISLARNHLPTLTAGP
jgi:hypothetical protein